MMRWFKHMTQTRTDEKISSFIDKCGIEGYGAYWAILETVASVMDKSDRCEVIYSLSKWSSTLGLHFNKVRWLLDELSMNGLLVVDKVGDKVSIKVPNLTKYRDEYSQKSGQTPDKCRDKLRSKIQSIDTEAETETDIKELTKVNSLSGKPDAANLFSKNAEFKKQAIEVIEFLNEKTGKKYRPTDTNLKFIIGRLKSGATFGQCRQVIAKKYREWKDDPKMVDYVRPATLFNATKFEQYLGELV